MDKLYCRMLETDVEVEFFVDNILKINSPVDLKRKAINIIAEAERNIKCYKDSTLTHREFRDFEYRDDKVRYELRKTILGELKDKERLDNDDNIVLGKGGAKPKNKLLSERKIFYIIGPPASGKSSVSNTIADEFGAYILDSDYVKRKLPEYKNQVGSATLLHDESDALIFNYENENLLNYCIENGHNMVIPKIGHKLETICNFCETFSKKIDYKVFLISIDLDREKATQRAYYRFLETKRYVPLSLIFDCYGNQPTLNYFRIKQQKKNLFSGFAQISTDVDKSEQPILLEEENLGILRKLYKEVITNV